jgi:hypothetical protein
MLPNRSSWAQTRGLGAPLRAAREGVEREWSGRLAAEEAKRKETDEWATELTRALEKEKKVSSNI